MRINGLDLTPFSKRERTVLVALGLYSPGQLTLQDLIEYVYPDPDMEPDTSANVITKVIQTLRGKLVGWRIANRSHRGYTLERAE